MKFEPDLLNLELLRAVRRSRKGERNRKIEMSAHFLRKRTLQARLMANILCDRLNVRHSALKNRIKSTMVDLMRTPKNEQGQVMAQQDFQSLVSYLGEFGISKERFRKELVKAMEEFNRYSGRDNPEF